LKNLSKNPNLHTMAEGNGDYNYSETDSDFKRKLQSDQTEIETTISDEGMEGAVSEKVTNYIRELLSERVLLDRKYIHCDRLLEQGKVFFLLFNELLISVFFCYQTLKNGDKFDF
jgi:hypothetical protein